MNSLFTSVFIVYMLQATEVEETIKRIQAHKGVMGVVIVNHEGLNFSVYYHRNLL